MLIARQFNFHLPGRGRGIRSSDQQTEKTFILMKQETIRQILKHKHFR